ncbi:MAG: FG-GAP repeat domain-containing protein [Terriglobia bacterium]
MIESLSESLANDLLDLSVAVRERDLRSAAEFFADTLEATPFPAEFTPTTTEVKWIASHGWRREETPRPMTRQEFLSAFANWLNHFGQIEDVRFKVKDARFEESAEIVPGAEVPTARMGSRGQARVAFFLVGRDEEDRREWVRGVVFTKIRRAENNRWQFEEFVLDSLDSLVATTDLFSEVALPAGVSLSRAPYGSAGNSGFAWHGAAAADWNDDGWIDLFVTGPDRNFLYMNNGKGGFQEESQAAGLSWVAGGVAPVALDYDNDGDEDVFISAVGPQILLENRLIPDGRLFFREVSAEAGVAVVGLGFSTVVGDVNQDGWPDVYVTCYNHYGRVVPNSWYQATNGTPNLLFVNQGNGRFREEAARWGVDDRRWSYAATFADLNGDGRQDLYVANDFGENGFFINQGDHFTDEARPRGVLDPGYGMGVSLGDYNNDGLLDLHVTNMSSTAGNRILGRLLPESKPQDSVLKKIASGNSLFENQGDGYFREVTWEAGNFAAGWGWGGGFFDFDNDGSEDLFVPNGFISGKSMHDT